MSWNASKRRKGNAPDPANYRPRPRVLVNIACGCKVWMHDTPTWTARLGCNSGLGHGYSLEWITAHDQSTGLVINNKNFGGKR